MAGEQLPIDLPPTEDELLGWIPKTSCAQCGKVIKQTDVIIGCIRSSGAAIQEHFCSLECREKWIKGFGNLGNG